MTEPQPKIAIRGLSKAFGPKQVLKGLDLDIPAGRSLVVIGGSGTGKSVLIKCILGIVEADAGSIKVDGEEVVGADHATLARIRAKFGMLFQGAALFDSLPVWRNVAFGLLAPRHAARGGPPARGRDAGRGRPRPRGRGPLPGRALGRHAEARRPRPRRRHRVPRSCSSTSRPPASTRSRPTSSTS